MIANPAISAVWFPGSDAGNQGVRRVVQGRLAGIERQRSQYPLAELRASDGSTSAYIHNHHGEGSADRKFKTT